MGQQKAGHRQDGFFARLFSEVVEQMLEAELTDDLGYERYEASGRNSGNSRNGHYDSSMRTSGGDTKIRVPRDRNGEFQSELLKKNSNEIEQKIITMYAKGTSTRDIRDMLEELYGIDVSPSTISKITDKIWELVEGYSVLPSACGRTGLWLQSMRLSTWMRSISGVFAHPLKKVQFSCNLRHFIMKLCCQTERLSAILAPVDWYYNPI